MSCLRSQVDDACCATLWTLGHNTIVIGSTSSVELA